MTITDNYDDLTPEQVSALRLLIELDKQYPAIKRYFDELDEALAVAKSIVGFEGYFAERADAPVYKIVEPAGKFVSFKKVGYERTKREDERAGSLSRKEADSALHGLEVYLLAEIDAKHRAEYVRAVLEAHRKGTLDVLSVYSDAYKEKERAPDESLEDWLMSCAEQDWDDGPDARCFPDLLTQGGKTDVATDAGNANTPA